MNVVIDGIEYVPKAEVPALTDESLQACLEVLTSMWYFNQQHKLLPHTWEAINALSPDLANLSAEEAFNVIHGEEEDM